MLNHQPVSSDKLRHHTIERFIPAPVETVFSAWISPDQLISWWGAGGGTAIWCDVDPRQGGHWRVLQIDRNGRETWSRGIYQEFQAPFRLTTTLSSEDSEQRLVQIDLSPDGDGTWLRIRSARLDPLLQPQVSTERCRCG